MAWAQVLTVTPIKTSILALVSVIDDRLRPDERFRQVARKVLQLARQKSAGYLPGWSGPDE
jgi:hypothetical protein